MPLTDKQKEYHKKYREEHKQQKREYFKKYAQEHREELQKYRKNYRDEHKHSAQEYSKNYITTERGIKSYRISSWKSNGVKHDDFDALYEKYKNTNECELCNIPITEGHGIIGKKHLDHDHITGEFRNILCGDCNINKRRFK